MRLFLVRHGQTDANVRGLFCGHTDLPLTDIGMSQAQQVASWLTAVPFSQATSSQLLRATDTARRILVGHDLCATADSQLNEMNFGDWEMCHHRDLPQLDPEGWAAWLADWQQATPTGGESFPQFAARLDTVAQQLLPSTSRDNHLLVAHQGSLSLILARLLGMPATAMWCFPFEQQAYSVVEINDGFTTLRAFNSKIPWVSAK